MVQSLNKNNLTKMTKRKSPFFVWVNVSLHDMRYFLAYSVVKDDSFLFAHLLSRCQVSMVRRLIYVCWCQRGMTSKSEWSQINRLLEWKPYPFHCRKVWFASELTCLQLDGLITLIYLSVWSMLIANWCTNGFCPPSLFPSTPFTLNCSQWRDLSAIRLWNRFKYAR